MGSPHTHTHRPQSTPSPGASPVHACTRVCSPAHPTPHTYVCTGERVQHTRVTGKGSCTHSPTHVCPGEGVPHTPPHMRVSGKGSCIPPAHACTGEWVSHTHGPGNGSRARVSRGKGLAHACTGEGVPRQPQLPDDVAGDVGLEQPRARLPLGRRQQLVELGRVELLRNTPRHACARGTHSVTCACAQGCAPGGARQQKRAAVHACELGVGACACERRRVHSRTRV